MKQLLYDTWLQALQDSRLGEEGNKQCDSFGTPHGGVQQTHTGRESQGGQSLKLGRSRG